MAGWPAGRRRPAIPVADRARYVEEYRSELWEIAARRGRPPRQLAYAARQVRWPGSCARSCEPPASGAQRCEGRGEAVLKQPGKAAAGVLPTALLTGLGLPALGALVFLAVLVLVTACWVIGSGDRAERVSRILLAGRGDASCLPPGPVAPSRPRPGPTADP